MSWDQVFQMLGHGLPADYIAFAETYGWVDFNKELVVDDLRFLNPDQLRRFYRLNTNVLRFGATPNGTYLAWLTEGHPDTWPVIEDQFVHEPDKSLTESRPWAHIPMPRLLLEMFTTDQWWLEHPPASHAPGLKKEDRC
ncbi:hypothetical protein ACSNOI_32460 [Actinomadura kijaniata]|uniref:hypothetical protein n=1 Tax=Actinomadura kijaniata TaxID=46161 RepID=UPI003F19D19E